MKLSTQLCSRREPGSIHTVSASTVAIRVRLPTPRRYRSGRASPAGCRIRRLVPVRGPGERWRNGRWGIRVCSGRILCDNGNCRGTGERARSVVGACVSDSLGAQ